MALKVGELFATINLDDKGFNKGLKAAHTALNGLKTPLKGVTWATGIMGAAWSAVGATSIKYNANIEQLQTSFEVMTGSAEEGAKVLERIRKLGAETPFETEGLAETVQLLMNYNLTADEAIDVMKMLGDVAQGDQEKVQKRHNEAHSPAFVGPATCAADKTIARPTTPAGDDKSRCFI